MKIILLCVFSCLIFLSIQPVASAGCDTGVDVATTLSPELAKTLSITDGIEIAASIPINKSALERRGCCSWHKGVCGCSGGRAVCCDGTLSPTCGCD